ncbi:MAG: hypothetical protein H7A23_09275 [Leptospiraceae bacterium]|nr:hypothetical protein [Leptospiraceae bacterium]MCP5494734.1 hypothetical protein [Leptospiraceae bacterium]
MIIRMFFKDEEKKHCVIKSIGKLNCGNIIKINQSVIEVEFTNSIAFQEWKTEHKIIYGWLPELA